MITVEIDDSTQKGRELVKEVHKRPKSARKVIPMKNGVPEGYMTPEEWKECCRENISEIFRKHEKGLLSSSA